MFLTVVDLLLLQKSDNLFKKICCLSVFFIRQQLHEPIGLEHQDVSVSEILQFLRLDGCVCGYPGFHLFKGPHGPVNLFVHVQEDVIAIESRAIEWTLTERNLKVAFMFVLVTAIS